MSAKTASKSTKSATETAKPVAPAAAAAPAKKTAKVVAAPAPAPAVVETKAKTPRGKKADASVTDSAVVSQLAASTVASEGEKTRRVVNNEEIEKSFDELSAALETELQSLRDDKTHSVGIRFIRSVARQIKSLKSDCFRLLSRKVKKPSQRAGNSGFMKNVDISPEMAKFCGFAANQLVSRVDVTKSICNYVKEKNLQNSADRRQFTPDAKLGALLGVTETITYYALQKHIQKHFPKKA